MTTHPDPLVFYWSAADVPPDTTGRYLLAVRVKYPRLIVFGDDEELTSIPSRLDWDNNPAHSDPHVVAHDLLEVIVDITDHWDCPP
jgi:hypothetical protein